MIYLIDDRVPGSPATSTDAPPFNVGAKLWVLSSGTPETAVLRVVLGLINGNEGDGLSVARRLPVCVGYDISVVADSVGDGLSEPACSVADVVSSVTGDIVDSVLSEGKLLLAVVDTGKLASSELDWATAFTSALLASTTLSSVSVDAVGFCTGGRVSVESSVTVGVGGEGIAVV